MSKVTDADDKLGFMKEGLMALGATAGILRRYHCSPVQAHPLDFSGFAGALRSVCQQASLDKQGADDLDLLVEVFAAYHDAVSAGIQLEATEFKRGLNSVRRYRTWLQSVFCKE